MKAAPKVWTFFYGSYINFEVLKDVDVVPENWEVARLAGFDIRIQPRSNCQELWIDGFGLVPGDRGVRR